MKKALMIIGGIFLVGITLAVGAVVVLSIKGSALDKESKRYVDAAISAIGSEWDMKELEKRASPEFKAVMNDADLEKLFVMFRRLGNLRQYNGSKGQARFMLTSKQGKVISGEYVGSAEFESGPA